MAGINVDEGSSIGLRQTIANSLRVRVLLLVLIGFAAVAIPAYLAFNWIVGSTVVQLATSFAEKQVLYDRHRGLGALTREVSLAETLAGSQSIRDWANDEADPVLMRRGIAELEHFRRSFADKSYFFVINGSNNYYFNDAANAYAGDQYRYTLSPENPRDAWYYATIALGDGCHLNVDNDANLGVTKVWMNCVIREGSRVLGVLGTGIDLTSFIREVVNVPQVGVISMFVDGQGAVQAHRDQDLINLSSLTSDMSAKRTVFSFIDREADRQSLRAVMASVEAGESLTQSRFMQVGGKDTLVGVGYLDKLGWYNVTLMDIDTIIDKRLFMPIGLLLAAMMALVAAVLMLVFKRQVLNRLQGLEAVVQAAQSGNYGPALTMSSGAKDQIGRLSAAFTDMAIAVSSQTQQLEARVRERTEELEALAFRDGQTGLSNRRGFFDAFSAGTRGKRRGLLLVDIDHFKSINDTSGHAAGDAVILEIAQRITLAIGADNSCARWGGDEFIVLLHDADQQPLRQVAQSVISAVSGAPIGLPGGGEVMVTVSIGACLVEGRDSIETVTEMADAALYMAKDDGRNRVVTFDTQTGFAPTEHIAHPGDQPRAKAG